MRLESFLEKLYFGELDEERFAYDEAPPDDPAVRKAVDDFARAASEYPPAKLEALGRVPEELLQRLREIGFFGLIIPREYGGLGLSLHQYIAMIERASGMDMALGILALAHLSIGVMGILLFGDEAQKARYLPAAASGAMIFCYALTEPLIGSDAKDIQTVATLSADGSHYILDGTKTFITNASYSGGLTVFAQLDRERPGKLGAFIVETAWEGVTIGKDMEKMGLKASSTGSIQLKGVRVPRENLIGRPGEGFKIAMTILNYGRLALGAASAGMLSVSLSDMSKRAATRVQFGRPLLDYELIREKLLEALAQKERVSAMTNLTASLLGGDPLANVASESSHCKLVGTNRAWQTLYDAMQVAGGSGYLSAQPYEKRMRDFRVTTIFEGTTEIHSIYPPLSLARDIYKRLKDRGPLGMALGLTALRLRPAVWRIATALPAAREAAREVRREARMFRRLFLAAFMRYGAKLAERELLLRRLTAISCELYGLLAVIARLRYLERRGDDTRELSSVLKYLVEEARAVSRRNDHLEADGVERRGRAVLEGAERERRWRNGTAT